MADRRSDLDALRGVAMILGIVLHATASFSSFPWPVHEIKFDTGLALLCMWIHGFRMPLFFILSGYFTQLVYEQRGLRKLVYQRLERIAIPLALGCVTILPLSSFVWQKASQTRHREPVVEAIVRSELQPLRDWIAQGGDPNHKDSLFGRPLVAWAALAENPPALELLVSNNADVNAAESSGNTPLHYAVFFGNASAFEYLVQHGSDPTATNNAKHNALLAIESSPFRAADLSGVIGLPEALRVDDVQHGRLAIKELLEKWLDKQNQPPIAVSAKLQQSLQESKDASFLDSLVTSYWNYRGSDRFILHFGSYQLHLFDSMFFEHLWFLAYLLWLLLFFTIFTAIGWKANHRTYWLAVFATLFGQLWMGPLGPSFGPDSEFGLLPAPHLLIYYAGFFFFGTAIYSCSTPRDASTGANFSEQTWFSTHWRWILPVCTLIVFPLAIGTAPIRPLSIILQPLFAWGMALGSIGAFEALFKATSSKQTLGKQPSAVRWLADSSYWLYLAHVPVVIMAQYLVTSLPFTGWIKFFIVLAISLLILLVSYEWLVRYSWIGHILNGRKFRPGQPASLSTKVLT
jgi:peptidoglycan/LPS O-acetylase OafA/YrhL